MQKFVKLDGFNYRYCALIHTDDILVISHDDSAIMEGVDKFYILKKYSEKKKTYCEPRRYLGANVDKFDFLDGSDAALFMSVDEYFK